MNRSHRFMGGRGTGWRRHNSGEPDRGRAYGSQVRAQEGLDRQVRFNLVATNGQVIATSDAYEGKASAIKGIESVKRNVQTAEIDDQTDK